MPVTSSWILSPPAPPAPTTPPVLPIPVGDATSRPFLGKGLLRPFQRDMKRDFASVDGEALVRACVGQILGTRASGPTGTEPGELPWRPRFGSVLYRLRHRKGLLQELAAVYVKDALARWEPRVIVSAVTSSFDRTTRVLTVKLRYNVIERNVPGNNVILRDIEQEVAIPLAA